ncbi:helix-turn-helix transcriptional regulator [Mesorhizobium sp. Root157]|uniref:helix-turn-helix transcriptional regulator n=1 Tax=Mesorhizobium sp. Root157 TaxID=1736477 RepID=UPI0009EBED8D|nr:AlpA family phage regulatory protein [Mesorhizobium sp. Root157]
MSPDNDNLPPLMSPKEAAAITSLSRTLLSMLADAGEFPKPVQLTLRRTAYVRQEVISWVDQRIAARAAA